MIYRRQSAIKLIVAVIVLSLAQMFVSASSTTQPAPNQDLGTPAVPMVGRLEVHRARTISVDNNDAGDGTTILDGQTLETSDCASATVHLLPVGLTSANVTPIGQIDLATNTKAIINYSAGRVRVVLIRGCARERMSMNLDAAIDRPDGTSTIANQPDTLNRKLAEVCYPSDKREDFTPVCLPPPIVWIGGGGAAAATVATIVTRGNNPSPQTPAP